MKKHGYIEAVSAVGAAAVLALAPAAPALAATITWSVSNITGNVADISTNGAPVEAHSGADGGPTPNFVDGWTFNVNGVTFDDGYVFDSPSHLDTINARAGAGISGDYYTLLRFADRQGTGNATFTFTNLTVGARYEIQIWHSDNSSVVQDNGLVLNDGGIINNPTHGQAGHATLIREVAELGPGQYAIGAFTANAATQQFMARAVGSLTSTPTAQNNTTINAVQLRFTAPPNGTLFVFE